MESIYLKCPVTSLLGTDISGEECILVGQGSFISLLKQNQTLLKLKVFTAAYVHEILRFGSDILVLGGKSVCLLEVQDGKVNIKSSEKIFQDWIWNALKINNRYFFLTAHNRVISTDDQLNSFQTYGCEEKCILYSGHLEPWNGEVCVLAGSVFSEVLIWTLSLNQDQDNSSTESPVLHRLSGHEGVLFSINMCSEKGLICSTSDDRSARVWKVSFSSGRSWESAKVYQLHVLYGHTARVFRSCITETRLITVGEDSKICVWNLEHGTLERSIEDCHTGSPIWSLSVLGDKTLLSGGGNGAVSSWDLETLNQPIELNCDIKPGDFPKLVKFIGDRILVLTNDGLLISVINEIEWIRPFPVLKTYAVMDNNSEEHILLGSLSGSVHILQLCPEFKPILEETVIQGKIFSAALFSDRFLVNGSEGRLVLASFTPGATWSKISEGSLPDSKQRWFSVAREWMKFLVLGDRVGSLHIYSQDLVLQQSFKKIHNRNGVTDIKISGSSFLSSGRDGTVRRFRLIDSEVEQLSCIRTGVDWLARLVPGPGIRAVSFHGTKLLLQDVEQSKLLSEVECGGGHRSWDILGTEKLVFIKDKKIFTQVFNYQGELPTCPGSHTQQINTMSSFRFLEDLYLCTGGEDTLIRIHAVHPNLEDLEPKLVLRGHVSSVKCMKPLDLGNGTVLLFTGGGRAQLKIWRILNLDGGLVGSEIADYMLRGSDKDIRRAWREAQSEVRHDPETRFLSLEVIVEKNGVYIYVGCSDSILRVFIYSENTISLVQEEKIQDHCILLVKQFSLNKNGFILSCTTGGSIYSWRRKNILSEDYHEVKLHQSGINSLDILEKESHCLFVTGGDDNALVLSQIQEIDNKISHFVLWREDKAHAAQITGAHFSGSNLYSVSVDQRIGIWKREEKREEYKLVKLKSTNIADIQETLLIQAQNRNLLCTVGIGLQIFST